MKEKSKTAGPKKTQFRVQDLKPKKDPKAGRKAGEGQKDAVVQLDGIQTNHNESFVCDRDA